MSEKKSVAFVSTGYVALQQKYIIKFSEDCRKNCRHEKIAVVTCNLFDGHFSTLLGPRLVNDHFYKANENLHFFDWTPFLSEKKVNVLISKLKNYTTVLWDFPDIEYIKKYDYAFMGVLPHITKVNILSHNNQNLPQEKFENEIRAYFRNHGLPLEMSEKGVGKWSARINYLLKSLRFERENSSEVGS